jgi:ribosomal protein L20
LLVLLFSLWQTWSSCSHVNPAGSAVDTLHSHTSADVKLDRKSLSELAKNEPLSFQQIIAVAKSALASNYDKYSQAASKAAQ